MSKQEIRVGDHVRAQTSADGVVIRIHTLPNGLTLYYVRLDLIPTTEGEPFARHDLELLP
jgi:hypothetical protein